METRSLFGVNLFRLYWELVLSSVRTRSVFNAKVERFSEMRNNRSSKLCSAMPEKAFRKDSERPEHRPEAPYRHPSVPLKMHLW